MAVNRRGFTLIELLVGVSLCLILVSLLGVLFAHASDAVLFADSAMQLKNEQRSFVAAIQRDVDNYMIFPGQPVILRQPMSDLGFLELYTLQEGNIPGRVRYKLKAVAVIGPLRYISREELVNGVWGNDQIYALYIAPGPAPKIMIDYYNDPTPEDTENFDNNFVIPAGDIVFTTNKHNDAGAISIVRVAITLTDKRQDSIRHFVHVLSFR